GMVRDGLKQAEIIRVLLAASKPSLPGSSGQSIHPPAQQADMDSPDQPGNDGKGNNPLAALSASLHQSPDVQALADRLKAALKDELPMLDREGGFIRPGYDSKLDELRTLRDESRRLIANLQARYKETTSIDSLK